MAMFEKLVDKRLIDRNLRKGLVNLDEYQAFLDQLVDCSDNIQTPEAESCEGNDPENQTQTETSSATEVQPPEVTDPQQVNW